MSRLLENSDQYRNPMISKNVFSKEDEYNIGNSRALSDGDVHGKGETKTVGSSDDIAKREELKAKNLYTKDDPYDVSKA